MCGIAGLIYNDQAVEEFDWSEFMTALDSLVAQQVEPSRPGRLNPVLTQLEQQSEALKEYPVIRGLLLDHDLQDAVARAAAGVWAFEQQIMAAVLNPEAGTSTELIEDWNAIAIRLRDLAWALERDALESARRPLRLLPPEYLEVPKAAFEAWKVGAVLENIGRLEVRGRDSLGLSVLVTFPSAQACAAFASWAAEQGSDWVTRRQGLDLLNSAILEAPEAHGLVFAFKVAQEVGALGDNVAALTATISRDLLFWKAVSGEGVATNMFSHTRWASNGIISEPNCHPVSEQTVVHNGKVDHAASSRHRVLAALNGDVDNYQELCQRLSTQWGRGIPPRIGTDAKIIPVMIDFHYEQTQNLLEAFCAAVSEFEGSVAIVMHSSAEPTRTYLALRGSGQSMFVGVGPHGYVFASELYGVVEHTANFVRMDGTRERQAGRPETAGQVLVLDSRRRGLDGIEVYSFDGQPLDRAVLPLQRAEITTRDINRGDHRHFLLKEISEAPESIRKTIRGKFYLSKTGDDYRVRMNLGPDVVPAGVLERLRSGKLRRILLIGQGTAAVAGQAVAAIMQRNLVGGPSVVAMKATELSGYRMDEDFSDALVIAISQSGTTTDTNRTVDMVKARGAVVIGIVNRRNSDLVYKVDGVLYTSDGRDIEMSVASTKAFYSQVVAGYLLTYQFALALGRVAQEEIYRELGELVRLPDLMTAVLGNRDTIRDLAERWAPTRTDWAVVGSGCTRSAADEIRIKLSELCYKSIATDFIEDKKHIDLSSEPLTLVCAAGLSLMALKDAVKEVAIFKSHKSIPIVICSDGFDAFEPYAAGVVYVPKTSQAASVLLNTLVGHLWGYHCALAIDHGAEQLRRGRAMAVQFLTGDTALSASVMKQVIEIGRVFRDALHVGRYNSSLSVHTGARLANLFQYFTGTLSLRKFHEEFNTPPTPSGVAQTLVSMLSQAIHELSRPIDAIKHQAKTITVGISRLEEAFEGLIFDAFRELQLSPDSIPYRDLADLRAISTVVSKVKGVTLYEVSGLGSLGEPLPSTQVKVLAKTGASAGMRSRADQGYRLVGTKEWTVRRGATHLGRGRKDQKAIIIIPVIPRGQVEKLVLMHLDFVAELSVAGKVKVLRDLGRYHDLKSQVTETDVEWNDDFLSPMGVADLVLTPVDQLAETLLERLSKATA